MNKPDTPPAKSSALFRLMVDKPATIMVDLDGKKIAARPEDTVASLLLRHVDPQFYRRSAVVGSPRAPLCMMGVCFECLIEIDGQRNQQACLVRVRDGMRIRRQMQRGKQS